MSISKENTFFVFLLTQIAGPRSSHARAEIRLMQVAKEIGTDWRALGRTLGVSESDLQEIENENDEIEEQAFVMLHTWAEKAKEDATSKGAFLSFVREGFVQRER